MLHIAAGFTGLVTLWVPLVVKKGGTLHRRVGWVYAIAMAIVAITGIVISGAKLFDENPGNDDGALFLLLVGLLAGSAANAGVRALRLKGTSDATRHPWDVVLSGLLALCGVAAAVSGAVRGLPLFLVFGVLSTAVGLGHLRGWLRPPSSRMDYWYRHMGGMLVSGIATVTAFLVVNIRSLGVQEYAFLVWTLPGVVGGAGITAWTRHYRRKFRDA